MQNPYEKINAATIAPLAAAIRHGLTAVRIARTRPLPDPDFTIAKKAFLGALKPARPKKAKPKGDTK